MAYEYSDKGITVQCVCPGPVGTDMISGILQGERSNPLYDFFIPNVKLFTASAMRTLGFSFNTTGYWLHALVFGFGSNPGFVYASNKMLHKKQMSERQKTA